MEKENRNKLLEEKTLSYLDQYHESCELTQIFEEKKRQFTSLFENFSIYLKILNTAKIVENNGEQEKRIDLFNLTDKKSLRTSLFISAKNCLKLYTEIKDDYQRENILGLKEYDFINKIREYSLVIDSNGKIFIITFFNNGEAKTYGFKEQKNALFLDLPIIVSSIIKDPSKLSTKTLKTIVENNPMSSLANIYRYVKNNSDDLENIPSKISNISSLIREINNEFSNFTQKDKIVNFGLKNRFIWINGDTEIPYLICEDKDTVCLKLDLASSLINKSSFKRLSRYYPVLIRFEKNGIVPYYLKDKLYQQFYINNSPFDEDTCFQSCNLIKLDSLLSKLMAKREEEEERYWIEEKERIIDNLRETRYDPYVYGKYFDYLDKEKMNSVKEKEWKIEKKRFEGVVSEITKELENFMNTNKIVDKLSLQKKTIKYVKEKIEENKQLMDEISCTLGNIYKNEILLTNI